MHDKCNTCFNKHMSKTYDSTRLISPCYTCLYNIDMIKTNNYVETMFPIQKIITNDDVE